MPGMTLEEARRARIEARDSAEWAAARALEVALMRGARAPEGELAEAFLGRGGAAVKWNPNAHPRDRRGEFVRVLAALKRGDSVELPGGTRVTRTARGFKVRRPRTLQRDVREREVSAGAAASSALRIDPTPRENDRVGGVRYRAGDPVSAREAGRLETGTPVAVRTNRGTEFGRVVGPVRRDDARLSMLRQDVVGLRVRFDSGRGGGDTQVRRVGLDGVRRAHKAPDQGFEVARSPGASDHAATIADHLFGSGSETVHFINDFGAVMDKQAQRERAEVQAKIRALPPVERSPGRRVVDEFRHLERELERDLELGLRSPGKRRARARDRARRR
jgi:hypothetical protein